MPKEEIRAGSEEARFLFDEAMDAGQNGSAMLKAAFDMHESVMNQLALKGGANSNASIANFDRELRLCLPEKELIDAEELMNLFRVKQMKGVVRPNGPQIESNTSMAVQEATKTAFSLVRKDNVKAAIEVLEGLQGVGPATASLILSYAAPDKIAFASDQVLDIMNRDRNRGYTVVDVMAANTGLKEAIPNLGGEDQWTAEQLGMSLWVLGKVNDSKNTKLKKVLLQKLEVTWNKAKEKRKKVRESDLPSPKKSKA